MQVTALSPVDQWFKDHPEIANAPNGNPGIVPPWLQDGDWPGLPPVGVDVPRILPIKIPPTIPVHVGTFQAQDGVTCGHQWYTKPEDRSSCRACHGVDW